LFFPNAGKTSAPRYFDEFEGDVLLVEDESKTLSVVGGRTRAV